MSKKVLKKSPRAWTIHAHWVIDGMAIDDAGAVFRIAQGRGFTGSYSAITSRLQKGDSTWERLLRPVDERNSSRIKCAHKKKQDEMADVIAALDARKKEMGL